MFPTVLSIPLSGFFISEKKLMFDELQKYKNNGLLFYEYGDEVLKLSQKLPNESGVFYILKLTKGKIKLTYISKSVVMKLLSENKELMLQRKMILNGVGNSNLI